MSSWWRYRSRPGIVGTSTYTGDMSFDEFVGRVAAPRGFAQDTTRC